jgi:hypothetical protein
MRNLWTQRETPSAVWCADVTALIDTPEELLSLMLRVYEVAAETKLVIPDGLDPAGDMVRRWETERVVDCFSLARGRVGADLAWYSTADRVEEGRVFDLGALLETLQPAPDTIDLSNRVPGSSPIGIKGGRISYQGTLPSPRPPFGEVFSITLYSDIWFPYVLGMAHPACDYERFFDNRELSKRHTPRLNVLIGTIGRLVIEAGGSVSVERADVNSLYAPWISEHGIALDGPLPPLMPESSLDMRWPALED